MMPAAAPASSSASLPLLPSFRDADGLVNAYFAGEVCSAVLASNSAAVKALISPLHEADFADLLEALPHEARSSLIALLGRDFDFTTLTEVDDAVREEILEELPNAVIAEGVRDLENDDAVYILEDLGDADQADVLAQLPLSERLSLQRGLEYAEGSVGRLMQTHFIAIPPDWTVLQAIQYCRDTPDLPDQFFELFVVDPVHRLVGEVPLDALLKGRREGAIADVMQAPKHSTRVTDQQEKAARAFQRYNLVSAPVVDEADRLVGVLMVDDIVDVLQEAADSDIKALGGVKRDEELTDNVWDVAHGRFVWLFVNMLTALAASAVIALFSASLEKMVALAILMPIVASQGGNAGTQTMTVVVRALATQELVSANSWRVLLREIGIGLYNGAGFAVLTGAVSAWWFADVQLGFVIGFAMVANLLAAALAGVVIPLTLERYKIDPAVASGTFVTTVTDIVGFFAFLATATYWYAL